MSINLFHFLTRTQIPQFEIDPEASNKRLSYSNTRSSFYPVGSAEVDEAPWDLSYQEIMQDVRFQDTLRHSSVTVLPSSPEPPYLAGEDTTKMRLNDYLLRRVRWALRAAQTGRESYISLDVADRGTLAPAKQNPDIVGYFYDGSKKRVPHIFGDVKCSWKWQSDWKNVVGAEYIEFLAVAGQINYYMLCGGTRYGYIVTDKEVALFRKQAPNNHIQMTRGFPLDDYDAQHAFTLTEGRVTALLALWYIHLLATTDDWALEVDTP